MTLTRNERRVLEALSEVGDDDGDATRDADALADSTGLGRGPVEGALELLEEKGYVDVEEDTEKRNVLTDEGREYAEGALPERLLHDFLVEEDEEVTMDELRDVDGFEIGIGHLRRKGWAEVGETVEPLEAPEGEDERALKVLHEGTNRRSTPNARRTRLGRSRRRKDGCRASHGRGT